jgi:citrate lyase beta subunit
LRSPYLDSIVIPKVQHAKDIHFVAKMVDLVASQRKDQIKFIACVETALGLTHLSKYCDMTDYIELFGLILELKPLFVNWVN